MSIRRMDRDENKKFENKMIHGEYINIYDNDIFEFDVVHMCYMDTDSYINIYITIKDFPMSKRVEKKYIFSMDGDKYQPYNIFQELKRGCFVIFENPDKKYEIRFVSSCEKFSFETYDLQEYENPDSETAEETKSNETKSNEIKSNETGCNIL